MIVTIHQPEHLPWLGYFNKMAKAEKYVILDSVQFEKNYFQNRNRIMGSNGVQWLAIPVQMKGHMSNTIATTQIAGDERWKKKYLNTIQMSYAKHPFFKEVFSVVEEAISIDTNLIADINISIFKAFADKLDIHPEFVRSSTLNIKGLKSDLILDICKATNADMYIAGPSGRDYLDVESFNEVGIEVKYNDYTHPVYPQRKTEAFVPYLSSLDLFMNCGFKEGREIIMKGNEGLSDF